jgi:hypothetical protein
MDPQIFRDLVRELETLEQDLEPGDNVPTRFH